MHTLGYNTAMSIESQIGHFTDAGERVEVLSEAEMRLSERVGNAVEQSFAATRSTQHLSVEDRMELWLGVDQALRNLHAASNGRLRTLSILHSPDSRGIGSQRLVVKDGDLKNPLFEPDSLSSSIHELPATQALRIARGVFNKAFDLFQSNTSNFVDFDRYRDRARTMTAQVVGNGGSSSHGTYASTDNNSS